jgi:hypothetical protein
MSAKSTVTSAWRSAISWLAFLQPARDGGRKDVEEEALRPCLLGLEVAVLRVERAHRLLALADEVLEEQVRRRREAGDVQDEHREDRLTRHRRCGEQGVGDARGEREDEESDEPGNGGTRAVEEEGAERRREGPDHDRASVDESAEAPLDGHGQHEEEGELAEAEEAVPPRHEEVDEARGRDRLVGNRDRRGQAEAKEPVDGREDAGERDPHDGGDDQRRFPKPELVGVLRQRPRGRDPLDQWSKARCDPHCRRPFATLDSSLTRSVIDA